MRVAVHREAGIFFPLRSIPADLDVDVPDFTVIYGKNGAGKSHLLNAIGAGQIRVTRGDKVLNPSAYASDLSTTDPFQYAPRQKAHRSLAATAAIAQVTFSDANVRNKIEEALGGKSLSAYEDYLSPEKALSLIRERILLQPMQFRVELDSLIYQSLQ